MYLRKWPFRKKRLCRFIRSPAWDTNFTTVPENRFIFVMLENPEYILKIGCHSTYKDKRQFHSSSLFKTHQQTAPEAWRAHKLLKSYWFLRLSALLDTTLRESSLRYGHILSLYQLRTLSVCNEFIIGSAVCSSGYSWVAGLYSGVYKNSANLDSICIYLCNIKR